MRADGPSLRILLSGLQADGLMRPGEWADVRAGLAECTHQSDQPWFVSALAGAGAWVAAVCFVAFLFQTDLIPGWELQYMLPWGAAFLTAAHGLRWFTRGPFPVQLSLALSAAGHILVLAGVGDAADAFWPVAATAVALAAIQYPINRDALHRYLSTLSAFTVTLSWAMADELSLPFYILIAAEMALAGWLLTAGNVPSSLRPLAYAAATALVGTHAVWVSALEIGFEIVDWPARVLGAGFALWVLAWCADRRAIHRHEPLWVAAVAIVIVSALAPPGLLPAVGLMALGYALADRIVLGLGIAFVPALVFFYYYDLDVGLDVKSYCLMASGLVLLAVRAILNHRPWAREEMP